MEMPSLVVGIIAIVVVSLVVVFGVVYAVLGRYARRDQQTTEQKYPGARHVESGALFFGQESRGVTQMRGNGTLILTDDELLFKQWVVSKEFRIPLRSIQSIETRRSFLGKTQGVQLLKVNYLTESGAPDAIAWRVSDLAGLIRKIEEART
ncbi:MAG TPA: hypothetical protein VLQ48_15550 [Chloroflexia bacterium]|nr:hypothetical protein [Chloroflexia bacterium]